MGVLERIATILRANLNANLDRAENPEIALVQMLREMEVAIQEARTHLLELQTIERQLEAEKLKYLRESREWGTRAERAVAVYREDAARDALQRRQQAENAAADYHKQWEEHHIVVAQFQDQLKQLTRRYEDTKRNRSLLLTRQRAALTQQRMQQVIQNAQQLDPQTPSGQLDRRVRRLEAETQAQAEVNRLPRSLEDELAQLDTENAADQQLNSLRQRYQEPPAQNWSSPAPVPPLPPPPRQRELWFADEPAPPPKEYWLAETPQNSATPEPPKEFWFADEPAPPQSTPATDEAKELWFTDEPAPPISQIAEQLAEPGLPQPPSYWFEEQPLATPPTTATELWFSEEIPPPATTPEKQTAKPETPGKKDYWFED